MYEMHIKSQISLKCLYKRVLKRRSVGFRRFMESIRVGYQNDVKIVKTVNRKINKYNKELQQIQQKMRESQPITRTENLKDRIKRIKRNVQIRKEKLYGTQFSSSSDQSSTQESKEIKEPCRQDKFYQQKLKNRQAAQKSRQQKKQYTTHLEEQIKRLKHIMDQCPSCKHQIQPQFELENTREDSTRLLNDVDFMVDSTAEDLIPEPESSFERMRFSEDSSVGMYLFVFMIIIGVFCIGARLDSGSTGPLRRDLLQSYDLPKNSQTFSQKPSSLDFETSPVHSFDINMNPTYSTHSEVDVDSSKYQNGLISMGQINSPLPIDMVFQKIITSFENFKVVQYEDKNLRSKNGLIDANKTLMYCTKPKIYKAAPNDDGIMTTFLDIFVQGIEIVNILSSGESNSLTSGSLQLDGLYKITASVEEIEAIPNPNSVY